MGFFAVSREQVPMISAVPEVMAAIAAAIYAVESPGVRPEVVAAITAAVFAAMGTSKLTIRIARTNSMWTVTG